MTWPGRRTDIADNISIITREWNFAIERECAEHGFPCTDLVPSCIITIIHPAISPRAWLALPEMSIDAAISVHDVLVASWKSGLSLQDVAQRLKEQYFNKGYLGELFDEHSNYKFDVKLTASELSKQEV